MHKHKPGALLESVQNGKYPLHQRAQIEAQRRWDSIAKPLGSLGLLERALVQIAGITGSSQLCLEKKCVVVMCADNGVVAQGVSQTSQEVTAVVTENLCLNKTSVCQMAQVAAADVIAVDIGVAREVSGVGMLHHKIACGTADMTITSAMTKEQAIDGIEYGIELVAKLKDQGYNLIAMGEMGIGNTTTSSAVTSVLLKIPVEKVTGKGAGLSTEGLAHKIRVIEKAIEINRPDPKNPLDVLAKVGGFDLAGLVGICLGGAVHRVPIILDGFISCAAALLAQNFCSDVAGFLLASHCSKEPAARLLLETLIKSPLLSCEMCLGEGTGAVAAFPLFDMALAVYDKMSTFSEIEIEEYKLLV